MWLFFPAWFRVHLWSQYISPLIQLCDDPRQAVLVFSHFVMNSSLSFQKGGLKKKDLRIAGLSLWNGLICFAWSTGPEFCVLSWRAQCAICISKPVSFWPPSAQHHELNLLLKGASNTAYISDVCAHALQPKWYCRGFFFFQAYK